jgi:hypothetical protein
MTYLFNCDLFLISLDTALNENINAIKNKNLITNLQKNITPC